MRLTLIIWHNASSDHRMRMLRCFENGVPCLYDHCSDVRFVLISLHMIIHMICKTDFKMDFLCKFIFTSDLLHHWFDENVVD
ncbi:hypothetical protein AVEN_269841-1 [Araneus ventricosus]|uniref:Uncharacterized protein n=1 Tax=Araneus ventricosus TaxID=182803 RepID=A0A4Y2CGD6_ARAVE|nr:hypothetical protein AVEN_269841-1 [Araneus ventricosus]